LLSDLSEAAARNLFPSKRLHCKTEDLTAKFGIVLALLALIGPDWLNAKDDNGRRRLDDPNDWVRLEIARALKRGIPVIPVLISGARLPHKESLPDDIANLLDHQAATVTTTGFRHEMAGLARDVRNLSPPRSWARVSLPFAAMAAILAVAFGFYHVGFSWHTANGAREPPKATSQLPSISNIGEGWPLYAVDKQPVAYFFKLNSILLMGNKVAYARRFVQRICNHH
jgi:hypothetical protein